MTDTKTKSKLSRAQIVGLSVFVGVIGWTAWTLLPAIKGDLEYRETRSAIEMRAQPSATAPAPKHHPRPAAETAPARSSKIVATLKEFQEGLPLLAKGKLETGKQDWGTSHSWKGPSGNRIVFCDDGGDGSLDRLMVLVQCSPNDEDQQLLGIATAYRVVELASGQTSDADQFMDSVLKPAIKGPITKWFGDTRVSAEIRKTDDIPILMVWIGNWE